MSVWRKTLVYLGLVEESDDYASGPPAVVRDGASVAGTTTAGEPDLAAARRGPGASRAARGSTNVRPLRSSEPGGQAADAAGSRQSFMRTASNRVAIVRIHDFDDVEGVGARYRDGQAVLFDVGRTDAAVGRRVLDFVSGTTFALRGRLTKVGAGAFLLVPDGVEVSPDERRRLADLGYGSGGRGA